MTTDQPPRLKKDDFVKAFGLVNASELNGKIGIIVVAPKGDGGSGQRVGVRFLDHEKIKSVKVDNLETVDIDRHFHFEAKDIPGIGFMRDGSEVPVRIENGEGKNCAECGLHLENQYHVFYDDAWLCEEDYVRKYIGQTHELFRTCALCHEYVPIREMKVLPTDPLKAAYPEGKLPNGTQLCSFIGTDMVFFAHKKCYTCDLCGSPMYIDELHRDGFLAILQKQQKPSVLFLCQGPPGSSGHCNDRHADVKRDRLRYLEIESLSSQEMCEILKDRGIPIDDAGDDRESLVKKVVVTDRKREKKVANVVTMTKSLDTPGAFANHACGDACGCESSRVVSRAAPGANIIDAKCCHGCPFRYVCWDNRERAWKRSVMSDDFMQFSYGLFDMTEQQCQETFPGCPVSPFINACNLSEHFWFTEGQKALIADREEYFIPRMMWSVAVSACSEEDGTYKYGRLHAAMSLITSRMIDMYKSKTNPQREDLLALMASETLVRQLKQMELGPNNLFLLMDSPELRKCDCMQYVAMAASLGTLRLKDSQVKEVKHRCALCKSPLSEPKFCSLCKEVAYCGEYHIKRHWKTHKRECKGRKKKNACAVCQVELDKPKVCGLCKEVSYCGKEHAAQHWRLHKKECKGRSEAK